MDCEKLLGFSVSGTENDWFRYYLSDRKQRVEYNGSKSTFRAVKYGVPHCSI